MVILGLGSNEGHCLWYLRQALHALRQQQSMQVHAVSPVYQSDALLPENAPSHWQRPYLNAALSISTDLAPDALIKILKAIEQSIGRQQQAARWSPRVVDIDLLAWGDHHQTSAALTIPHASLLERPFALWPLLDLMPDWVVPNPGPMQGKAATALARAWGDPRTGDEAPLRTRRIPHRIDTPALVGILNITPDSFSDGKSSEHMDDIVARAMQLVDDGAQVIDIGAESTRPGATPLTAAQEWQRLEPVLDALKQHESAHRAYRPELSIDSYHAQNIERVIAWGADWINDVSGRWAAHFLPQHPHLKWVLMRPKNHPISGTDKACVAACMAWAQTQYQALTALGVSAQQLAFDPGIGFGCSSKHTYALLAQLPALKTLPMPLYIGHSRKSFLAQYCMAPASQRDPESLAVSWHCAQHGIDYLRVHQVQWHARAFAMQHHFQTTTNHRQGIHHHEHMATGR